MPTGQFALARYNTNGTLDTTFGTAGREVPTLPVKTFLSGLAIGADGKIVAAGQGTYQDPAHPTDTAYSAPVVLSVRFNSTGALDTSYNGVGYAYQQIPSHAGLSYAPGGRRRWRCSPMGK